MARPDSIKAIGLKKYLDQTADQHNNFGYEYFVKLVNVPRTPSTSSMARIFNVSDLTVRKWLSIYEDEKRAPTK